MKEKFGKLKKYFGGYDVSWKCVIILALVTAVYAAAVCIIPVFKNTSFHDPAVNPEFWIPFALFIIVNSKKWYEAVVKCFAFFLISQPLIYLLQVPFSSAGWGIFSYYGYWFKITLLTIPAAAAAFLIKKKNLLSAVILSCATCFTAVMAAQYIKTAMYNFPRHFISVLFCLALIVFLIFVLLDKKSHRALALALAALALAGSLFIAFRNLVRTVEVFIGDRNDFVQIDDHSVVSTEILDDYAVLRARRDGNTRVVFENRKGEKMEYDVTVYGGSMLVIRLGEE